MVALMAAGMVTVPVEGQQPPPSFAVLALIVVFGTLLIGVKFALMIPISATEQLGPIDILKRSWRLTSGNYLRLLGFLALMIFAAIVLLIAAQAVGLIAGQAIGGKVAPLTLGALVLSLFQAVASTVMTTLLTVMLARLYVQLSGRGDAHPSVPSSGI
jgi:membrane-anchored glycerophosphoryl diester phosphodiesterase (GDPDase)